MTSPYPAVAAIIVGVAVFQVANAVVGTYLPIRLQLDGFSELSVGLVATAHALGFMAGCVNSPRVIRRVGHIRSFAVFAAACAVLSLSFALRIDPYSWFGLRVLVGFFSAGLFTVAESWLNDQTPAEARGSVISVYMIGTKLAFAGGQALLPFGDIAGLAFFMIAGAFYAASLIPVALTRAMSPAMPSLTTLSLRTLYRIAPAAAVGCFATGLMNSAVISIAPLYGTELALSTESIAILLVLLQLGSLALQWPLGWLSDRFDRRLVIVGSAAVILVLSLAIGFVGARSLVTLYVLFALWGGFALSIYAICIAHANDFSPPGTTVALASTLLLAWAAGSVIGPTVATLAMEQFGPAGLFHYTAVIAAWLTAFVAWRMTRRQARPAAEREPFVNLPATSPIVSELSPRRTDDERAVAEAEQERPAAE